MMSSHLQSTKIQRGPSQLPCAATAATTKHETSHQRPQSSGLTTTTTTTVPTATAIASNNLALLLVFIITTCFSSSAIAVQDAIPIQDVLPLSYFPNSEILLVDPRASNPPLANWDLNRDDLRRRKDPESTIINTAPAATTLITHTPSSTALASTTSGSTTTTVTSAFSLPSPFDASLGNNFTEPSCPDFIDQFISTATFKSCLPFSLLLQTSESFFKAQQSPLLLTETLDTSCSANSTLCTNYFYTVANNLTADANCKADFDLGNPTVIQARNGLLAYQTLYQATCLHNPTTKSYCAVDAFTNTSSPTDSYPYYLPLGVSLPGGTTPTCDVCLEDTMAIFQKASANRSQPVFQTYASAAQQINVLCGPTFSNASIPAASSNGAGMNSAIGSGEGVGALVLVLAVALWMF